MRVVVRDVASYYFHQWVANEGMVVISIDGRGTPYRGKNWESAIKHDFITAPLNDQIEGLQ